MSALCAETDPELFFPRKGESPKAAKRLCERCELREGCLADALSQEFNPEGIWAGTTFRERAKLRAA